ncbi:MAG: glutathione S-transferase family protein, partial [Candidatus Sedimenticola sp. (ex Thyasira tokunagai)]
MGTWTSQNLSRGSNTLDFSDAKVPVLQDGDLEVWDSLAILEYLVERFPEKPGWPRESGARAVA